MAPPVAFLDDDSASAAHDEGVPDPTGMSATAAAAAVAPVVPPVAAPPVPAAPAAVGAGTSAQNSALAQAETEFQNWFNPTDAATLAQGAWQQIVNGVTDGNQILQWLRGTAQYQTTFAGLIAAQKAGIPVDPNNPEGTYLQYVNNAVQMARAVGMPAGTITTASAGDLYAKGVSTDELSARINTAYADALTAGDGVHNILGSWGVPIGSLAAYYLDPDNALPMLQQQFTAAQIANQGSLSGFGALDQATAMHLASLGITNESAKSDFGTIAPLVKLQGVPLGGAPGATVTADQLIGAGLEGNADDIAAVSKAQDTRTSRGRGGGGLEASPEGIIGSGYARSA